MKASINSRIRPLIRFNRRERIRKRIALYLLLVLLTTIVFEEGEKIVEICSASSTMTISNPMMVSSVSPTGNESTAVVATAEGNSKDQSEVGEAKASPAPASIKELVAQTFPEEPNVALAIMEAESQGDGSRIGDKEKEFTINGQIYGESCGLMQIRIFPGRPDCQTLLNPKENLTEARKIYERYGWSAWSTFKSGQYLKYI